MNWDFYMHGKACVGRMPSKQQIRSNTRVAGACAANLPGSMSTDRCLSMACCGPLMLGPRPRSEQAILPAPRTAAAAAAAANTPMLAEPRVVSRGAGVRGRAGARAGACVAPARCAAAGGHHADRPV